MESEKIFKKIREARLSKGFSLEDVSEELKAYDVNLTKSALSRLETGARNKLDVRVVVALSNILDYDFIKLFGDVKPQANDISDLEFEPIPLYEGVAEAYKREKPLYYIPFPKLAENMLAVKYEENILVLDMDKKAVSDDDIGAYIIETSTYIDGLISKGYNEDKDKSIKNFGKVIKIMKNMEDKTVISSITRLTAEKRQLANLVLRTIFEK